MTTTNTRLPIDPAQIERDIVELARYTNPDVPFTRLAFTDLDKQARQVVSRWKLWDYRCGRTLQGT